MFFKRYKYVIILFEMIFKFDGIKSQKNRATSTTRSPQLAFLITGISVLENTNNLGIGGLCVCVTLNRVRANCTVR